MSTTPVRKLRHAALARYVALRHRLADPAERDRGDVPGWVLITLMTAGLVTTLWAFAAPALKNLFSQAINGVSGP